jgi:pyruvate dehydrogenase E2 component (dihydrolipoamide acetyltransferase)
MAVNEFKLPDVGEGLTEAEIVTWLVEVGDTIKVNDIVCEIETAKSLVELPSPYAGKVTRLMVPQGEMVAVGTPIIAVASGADAEAGADVAGDVDEETTVERPPADLAVEPGMVGSPAPKADGATPTLVGYGPRAAGTTRRARKPASSETAAPPPALSQPAAGQPVASSPVASSAAASEPATNGSHAAKVLAQPPVRKLAKDLGVDLAAVQPTGPDGTISRNDVQAYASGASASGQSQSTQEQAAAAAPRRSGERETRVPIKGVRKMTAQAMVSSAFTAPHVTEWITFDATKTMRLVERLRADRAFADVKVSPLLLVARAVCLAIRRTPEVNATWDEAAQEIVLKHYDNLGIAAATPRGLVVPNIKDADAMTARELAGALGELTTVARTGKTQPAHMAGGTFTITNVGVFGVDAGTPILNPGESAILAMGAIRKQPWMVGNKIKPRWITTLALSFDHRIVDGQQGSQFLADVASILESPGRALLY